MCHRGGMYKEAYHALEVGEQFRGWQMQSDLLESSVRFANAAIDAPSEFHPTALLGDVNSELSEYYPALYSSGDRMVFTRELVYRQSVLSVRKTFTKREKRAMSGGP